MNKVYLDELENAGNELVNYSQNSINDKLQELKLLPNNLVWQGLAHNSYINGYNNLISELIKLNGGLTKLANFLLLAKDNYNDTNEKINNTYEELLAEFKDIGK